jgi:hypothetical protein
MSAGMLDAWGGAAGKAAARVQGPLAALGGPATAAPALRLS